LEGHIQPEEEKSENDESAKNALDHKQNKTIKLVSTD